MHSNSFPSITLAWQPVTTNHRGQTLHKDYLMRLRQEKCNRTIKNCATRATLFGF